MQQPSTEQLAAPSPSTSKEGVALGSVFASLALTGGKLLVGLMTGSLAVIAEAAHSGLDLAAAAMTYWAVRVADKPSDINHPYGHHRVENISALFETLLLFLTCGWILYEAIERLLGSPAEVQQPYVAAGILLVSIGVDTWRSRLLKKAAKEHNSQALEADALHFSTDIFSSLAGVLGVLLVWVRPLLHLPWLAYADAAAAIAIALLTLTLSWRLGLRTLRVLTDEVSPELQTTLEAAVRQVDGLHGPYRVRTRLSGNRTFVDVVAHVPDDLPTRASHDLADRVEEAVSARVKNSDVVVHLEPMGKHRSTHD